MSITESLHEVARLKRAAADAATAFKDAEAELVKQMEALGQKTVEADGVKGTLVKGSTVSIDPERLEKVLGPKRWKQVTKQVLDKEKLEAHIVTGDIDAQEVANVSTTMDSKPYIRISGDKKPPAAKKRAVKKPTR